ncbi:MAG: multiheme c-type cytochrome [Phycisphaerae bacterium]
MRVRFATCATVAGLVVGLVVLSGSSGCPAGGVLGGGIGGSSELVGADVCRGCHHEIHTAWSGSRHAAALQSLVDAGQSFNPSCLPCHTTGYGAGGFVSPVATPKFGGVQCESCHGSGARHVGTRNPADIVRVPGTVVCAGCHTGPARPEFDEWALSRHALALDDVRNSPDRADDCLRCHATDYATRLRKNEARALVGLPPLPVPSIADADASNDPVESVGCTSCHAPHASDAPRQLRVAGSGACTGCHADPTLTLGVLPHAPQQNLLQGSGARRAGMSMAVELLPGLPGGHGAAGLESLGGCAKCHGAESRVANPDAGNPNHTGHRFEIAFTNCTPCHPSDVAESLLNALQTEIDAQIPPLRQRIADARAHPFLVEPNRTRLSACELNLDFLERDGSHGAHNAPYARQMLIATDALLDAVEASLP